MIYYRILSTTKPNDATIESYWDSTEYSNGDSIFSNSTTNTEFSAFLNTDMIAAQASIDNKNYAYGEVVWNWPAEISYGWYNTYPYIDNAAYGGNYLDKCLRDVVRTVSPCCQVTITKK